MDDLPFHLRPLLFDHDAAFRANWAIEELIARVDAAATNRAGIASYILESSEGPFADHLRHQTSLAGDDAAFVVGGLRQLQRQIAEARDAARAEDVRRQLAADDWRQEQEFAALVERALLNMASPAVPALPN